MYNIQSQHSINNIRNHKNLKNNNINTLFNKIIKL